MSEIIVPHDHPKYVQKWNNLGEGKFNGAYYYAKDIEEQIIPNVETDRPWNVLGIKECKGKNRMIVFVHNYIRPENYVWLKRYRDIIIVSSDYEADKILNRYGMVAHLPLSINVKEIEKYKTKKTQKACYYGNPWKFKRKEIAELVPPEVHRFGEMPKEQALKIIAQYKECYAIGLCAIEAQVLGCELKMSRYRYPDPAKSFPVLDCKDAAKMLQKGIDELEKHRAPYVDCSKL